MFGAALRCCCNAQCSQLPPKPHNQEGTELQAMGRGLRRGGRWVVPKKGTGRVGVCHSTKRLDPLFTPPSSRAPALTSCLTQRTQEPKPFGDQLKEHPNVARFIFLFFVCVLFCFQLLLEVFITTAILLFVKTSFFSSLAPTKGGGGKGGWP